MRIVDCHIHISKIRKDPLGEVLGLMDRYGIEKGVVFPGNEPKPDNRWMAKLIAPYRERFLPFAWLNPLQPDSVDELDELVKNKGFTGVKFHPLFHGFYPNRDNIRPIAERAAEYDIPILVHSGHPHYATPWQVGEMAALFPEVTVIMDHMGLQVGWVDDAITLAKRHSNIILGTTAMPFHEKIRLAVDTIGMERVVYGSDAPTIHPLPEIDRVKVAGLTSDEEEMVFGVNLLRILKAR
ncbi:MAG: amidohydrolase family protein [Planctomycetota bacterium]|jgi:predicted TIM-barrel fold metal-dependent hydrolase|nr:amidohydrolase family protein [Planctomycetota bacterium]